MPKAIVISTKRLQRLPAEVLPEDGPGLLTMSGKLLEKKNKGMGGGWPKPTYQRFICIRLSGSNICNNKRMSVCLKQLILIIIMAY